MWKKKRFWGIAAIILLLGVIVGRAFWVNPSQPKGAEAIEAIDKEGARERLSQAIRIPTVSYDDSTLVDPAAFVHFHSFLKESFPLLYAQAVVRDFPPQALLFELPGSDPSLHPLVLMAHHDVVPASAEEWSIDPFGGVCQGDTLWGRGTLDNKSSLMAILEAVEARLARGIAPRRTLYLCSGSDEETLGLGAKAVADYLSAQGVRAEMVLDEGLVITRGMVPLVSRPVALVGSSEKGYATYRLELSLHGGHSSTPASRTAIDVLAKAIQRVHDHPFRSRFAPPVEDFLSYLTPQLSFPARLLFANRWLFDPLLLSIYRSTPSGNALVTSTIVPTVVRAGEKSNSVPTTAYALLNARLLPGDSVAHLREHLEKVIDNPAIRIVPEASREASPVSTIRNEAFARLTSSIRATFDDLLVMPNMMIGGSDARSFYTISDAVYRFAPYQLDTKALNTIHGVDERIALKDYYQMIDFYGQVIHDFCD